MQESERFTRSAWPPPLASAGFQPSDGLSHGHSSTCNFNPNAKLNIDPIGKNKR